MHQIGKTQLIQVKSNTRTGRATDLSFGHKSKVEKKTWIWNKHFDQPAAVSDHFALAESTINLFLKSISLELINSNRDNTQKASTVWTETQHSLIFTD